MTRRFYEDENQNERFIRIYKNKMYCPHGIHNFNPCICCREEYRAKIEREFRGDNFTFFKDQYDRDTHSFDSEDDYEVEFCELRKSESFEDLKKEYHNLARIHHPDKGGDTGIFQRLSNLYEELRTYF